MRIYLIRHLQACIAALGKLYRQPVGNLLTIAVIGIALALPGALSVLVRNGEALAGGWEHARDYSVYLKPGQPLDTARKLREQLLATPGIEAVQLISADEALEQLRETPGFADVIDTLDENPLPHTLVVRPEEDVPPAVIATMAERLTEQPEVDQVRLDTQWVARLNAMLDLLRRSIWISAVLLVGAVIVIVGNTIRLDIQNQRAEIEVSKLLGATDGFVRRPFLYAGFWYGLAGGLFGLMVLSISLAALSGPASRLSSLYGGSFQPLGLDGATALAMLGGGLLAGLGGAWMAVGRHLAAIQPRV